LETNIDYLVQDCSAATQNALLAIHELGIGGVWINCYPNKEIIDGIRKYYQIPEDIIPVSILSIGYPAEKPVVEKRFNKDRIHLNKW
jgi:nitroreductase